MTKQELKKLVRDVPDFPKKGIVFKDITPLFQNQRANLFIAESLIDQAMTSLDSVPKGSARDALVQFAEWLTKRNS